MISLLTSDDLAAWKEIRLESLERCPTAFLETPEHFLAKTDEQHFARFKSNDILGFKDAQGALLGTVGFYVELEERMQHRGQLWAVYVRPPHRGKGIASALMEAVMAHAKTKVSQVHLSVETENHSAIALYKKHGFTIYGTEPKAVCVNGKYYDDHLMVRIF